MNITNRHNIPDVFIKAMQFNDRARDNLDFKMDQISVTKLIESPRLRLLSFDHYHKIEVDASERIFALWGQAVHAVLSWADSDSLTEQRLYTKVLNWTVSGQFDKISIQDELLCDYKTTSVWAISNGVKTEWNRQLQVLRYLAERHGYSIKQMEVVCILRDWQNSAAQRDPNYPQIPVLRFPVTPWYREDIEAYLYQRVKLHQEAAYTGMLPDCTAEERWSKPDQFAVKKTGRKTALRVFDRLDDANELISRTDQAYLEVRPGTSVRCQRYCTVAKYCSQYQTECQANHQLATAA